VNPGRILLSGAVKSETVLVWEPGSHTFTAAFAVATASFFLSQYAVVGSNESAAAPFRAPNRASTDLANLFLQANHPNDEKGRASTPKATWR
jgi:hypothetical protein